MARQKDGSKIDPLKGVVKPDELRDALRRLSKGDSWGRSYVRGALQYLERKPPNKVIVPLLKKALEKFKP